MTFRNPRRFLGVTALALAALSLQADQPGAGRRLLVADDAKQRLAIVAADGALEWELKVGAIHDASVLANGNILLQQGWQMVIEVTPARQTVWEYDSGTMNGN